MKKIGLKLLVIVAVFVTLTVSVLALQTTEDQALAGDTIMIADDELSEVLVIADENIIITDTVDFNGKAISLSESVNAVTDNVQLKEDNFAITKWETSSNDAKMVDRDIALRTAITEVLGMTASEAYAEKVNIALVKFSNLILPKLPETDISLTEIPVWFVTFERIDIKRGSSIPREKPDTAPAIVHVIVDAYSGNWLMTTAYGISE